MEPLIWVYTVCQCPFYGTLGINGLYKNLLTKYFLCSVYQRNRNAEEDKKRDSAILEALLEKLEKQGGFFLSTVLPLKYDI